MGHRKSSIVRVVLIAASGLLGALGCMVDDSLSRPVLGNSISLAFTPAQLTPQAYLPLVLGRGLIIYDRFGTEQDWNWLVTTFGAVTLDRGTGTAHVAVLREVVGPNTLVVHVENSEGIALENVPVVFYWPGASPLPPEQQACGLDRGDIIYTKSNGNAEFSMGPGAYYFPPDAGPHVAWVAVEGTDCLRGLGMLGGTNHIHLDSEWTVP